MKLDKIIERYNKGQDNYLLHNEDMEEIYVTSKKDGSEVTTVLDSHSLLIDPFYKYLDHFHNCKEWMNEFWEWMEDSYDMDGIECSSGCGITPITYCKIAMNEDIPKQMLTGYIIEFLMED